MDLQSLDKWDDYTAAKEAMFFYTDTADAPWTVIKSDDKKRARINCMRHLLHSLRYADKDDKVATPPDALLVGSAAEIHHHDRRLTPNRLPQLQAASSGDRGSTGIAKLDRRSTDKTDRPLAA